MQLNLHNNIWPLVQQGDKDAYSELYVYYYKRLFNYGRKFTEDLTIIEDAIQEVFITLWINRNQLSSISAPDSYLFYSFRNNILKKLKQRQRLREQHERQQAEPTFSIEAVIIEQEVTEKWKGKLEDALKLLTSRQREAIFLRFYEGMSYEQVAEVMHISIKATYKIMARALLQLKEVLSVPIILLLMVLKELPF